jgi:VWFA-related protein
MKALSSTLIILLVVLFPTAIFSQTPSHKPKPLGEDVVKITTTLIQVDATVLDKKGNPVKGLTADDFEIYENGKRQPITNFSFVELEADNSTGQADKSTDQVVAKPSKNSIPIPLAPVRLRPEQVHRTVALVVDDLGLSVGSIDHVKSSLKKFVDEQMLPGDVVAIIRTGSGAGALQQFTTDKRILHAAIARIRWNPHGRGGINIFQVADPSDEGAARAGSQLEASPEALLHKQNAIAGSTASQALSNQYNQEIFAVGTLGAVNYVVRGMRELPGRKAVVLFSDGFALYDFDNGKKKPNPRLMDNFQRLSELANRSSVIIYSIDARGVVNPLMMDAEDSFENFISKANPGAGDRISVVEQKSIDRSTQLFESQAGLRALAEQTGGFAVINNNNLSKGIERIMNDQTGYYVLGYQPSSESFDASKVRFNKLTVKVLRPDVRVRYRTGFFSVTDADSKPPVKTPRQQIYAALTSPFNSSDIDLRLTSLLADDAKTGVFMRSLLYVNGANLKFIEEPNGWHKASFDIVAMIFGENGTIVDEVSRTETIKARAETLQEIIAKGFVSTITVPIKKPGAYQMRVVMRDTDSGRVGSATQFVEVPNLKKDRLTLSGILLQRLPKPGNVANQEQFQPDEQRDFARRRFQLGDNIRFDLSIYNARAGKTSQTNLMVQYRILKHGKEIFIAPEKPLAVSSTAAVGTIDTSGVFKLGKNMPPGDYVLQVIVRDLEASGKSAIATQWADFEIMR